MDHSFPVTVFYEDTDMGGIVYHANYLKYIERARSDWVRGLGLDQLAMRDAGTVFAVRRIESDFLAPARLDERLEVRTGVLRSSGARLLLAQAIRRGPKALFRAKVELVAIDSATGGARRLPLPLRALAPG